MASDSGVNDNTTDLLTPRETAVLEHAAGGSSNQEIGRALFISAETVKTYKRQLLRKLEAKNTAHAIALAFHCGLLMPGRDDVVAGLLPAGRYELSSQVGQRFSLLIEELA